jgi:hypothetical protein
MELRKFIKTILREHLNEHNIIENSELTVLPNISRSSGFGLDLVYLSLSKSYANAYANGQTSAAHEYRQPIKNGVLFYVCLDNIKEHYGGDVWVSGYKDEIIDNLISYKEEWNEEGYSEHQFTYLTETFLNACGFNGEPTLSDVDLLINQLEKNNLSLISPLEWSLIQEEFGGYSEIALKRISPSNIIKVELYENGEIIKTINGDYQNECETIFYHGSPLNFWKHLL